MAEFTVLDTRVIPALDPTRLGKEDVLVVVSFGGTRQSVLTVPRETFSESAIIAAVRDQEAKVSPVRGKTLSF